MIYNPDLLNSVIKNILKVGIMLFPLLLSQLINAQTDQYIIGPIEHWESFLTLNKKEQEIIYLEKKHDNYMDSIYASSEIYAQDIHSSIKLIFLNLLIEERKSLEFNRSRWYVKNYQNKVLKDSSYIEGAQVSKDCSCILKNNQISLLMGTWVFGGVFLSIQLEKDFYTSQYILDAHELTPYKYTTSDSSLVSMLALKIKNSRLILDEAPAFQVNESLKGMIEFKTPIYYTDPLYNKGLAGGSAKIMDSMLTKGKIYFTCRVKENRLQER